MGTIVALGCSRSPAPPVMAGPVAGLSSTLEVDATGAVARLTLHVTNSTQAPMELEFSSGQRYDFQVTTEDGESLWSWSADRSFMQAVGTETLPAGGTLRYSAEWPTGGRQGRFIGIGELTSTSHPVRQSVYFEIAGDE